jgi:hypothetical protein
MDVLHARMFRLTNDDMYKQRAISTARGIFNTFVDSNGGFLNDRDGWANGTFVREWIIEVYPLLAVDLQQKASDMFNKTAHSILANDRTSDGYYGPDWNAPADAVWSNGTKAQQIMTSATAVDFVAGPPLIAAHLPIPSVPQPLPPIAVNARLLGQTGEDLIGALTQAPDGVKDVHVRLTGVTVPLSGVEITTTDAGHWLFPADGVTWIIAVRPQSDPSVVDLYFNFWQSYASYNLTLKFSDGRSVTVRADAPPLTVSAMLLGQTGEDVVGMLTQGPDGTKDVHIKLTGVTVPLSGADITTPTGRWLFPADGSTWIVAIRPQSDPTVVDLYLDYWQQFSLYNLNLKFSDGRAATVQAQ